MKRRHTEGFSLLLMPFLLPPLVFFGAKPLAHWLTGVEPPKLIGVAPAEAARHRQAPRRVTRPKGIDI